MAISFTTSLLSIGNRAIVRLPKTASAKLPSRGQAMVEGTINGLSFQTPLEPDGAGSHWFELQPTLQKQLSVKTGQKLSIEVAPVKAWPDPQLPADFEKALKNTPSALELWQKITPMARWEWVRWTRSTLNTETRQRRIEVACSKLSAGERRPCCWNRNLSTEPAISKNGVLLSV